MGSFCLNKKSTSLLVMIGPREFGNFLMHQIKNSAQWIPIGPLVLHCICVALHLCCIAYWVFNVVFTLVGCIQSARCIAYWVFNVMYNSEEQWSSEVVEQWNNQANQCCIAYWVFSVVYNSVECIQSACCIAYWVFIVMYNPEEQWSSEVVEQWNNQANQYCIAYSVFSVVYNSVECIQSACCIAYWVFINQFSIQWSSGVVEQWIAIKPISISILWCQFYSLI